MTVVSLSANTPLDKQLQALNNHFAAMFTASTNTPDSDREQRLDHILQLKDALLAHKETLVGAMSEDFGHRSREDSLMADILPCLQMIRYTRKNLKRWMKPSKRSTGLLMAPAKVAVHYQPLGVVGIMVPWNFPLTLSLIPLVTALAAGNRVMIKMSELTPATNAALKIMLASAFDEKQVCLVEGDVAVSGAFSGLPFDHLLFTGSGDVGKKVMAAAAENLTPVTLELGGKSPLIVAPDIPAGQAASRMLYGKCLNAGQICVAPDHCFVPQGQLDELVEALKAEYRSAYPQGLESPDWTSIINPAQFDRLVALLDDAKEKGARVIPLAEPAIDKDKHRIALHLVINPPATSAIMQHEIFGPLLPVIGYRDCEAVLQKIRHMPRPLALYLMTEDTAFQHHVIRQTHSGSVAINDTVMQVAVDDTPFGGVGASGMGHYHGIEGFRTFSHAKTVFMRGKINPGKLLQPPYGKWWKKLVLKLVTR